MVRGACSTGCPTCAHLGAWLATGATATHAVQVDQRGRGVMGHSELARLVAMIPGLEPMERCAWVQASQTEAAIGRRRRAHRTGDCLWAALLSWGAGSVAACAYSYSALHCAWPCPCSKFIMSYLYQFGTRDGQLSLKSLLAAVRAFGTHQAAVSQEEGQWQASGCA